MQSFPLGSRPSIVFRAGCRNETFRIVQGQVEQLESFRDKLSSGRYGPELVVVPEGRFTMGSHEAELQALADKAITGATGSAGAAPQAHGNDGCAHEACAFLVAPILQAIDVLLKYNGGPAHEVSINRPFAIGRYPVTVADYRRFSTHPLQLPEWLRDNFPVGGLNWGEVTAYAAWLFDS